jgi:hypothetical protein
MESVRLILDIPPEVIPLNVIPVGHPTGEDKPKKKFNPKVIHSETWKNSGPSLSFLRKLVK